uniref:N-acylglucosamine 2-epimerase (GlcNAc 2-epimerase) n=1 Tax=Candidatus Kentrum sp. FM TaxID=2126340 RepID=A0A450VUB7_9GAMM|nr:MAG: N-acylglucosamine 2-epimerase (GlcNAc 2-epimerase) [Candidatus Kentron sp. FM]VFJ49144.1 MAG: N-acylglucosamine 2-epimerase (GlcNAc 2-epimerase) [Candidatus Kentron sp. FM]VFK08372.1 MAG: N-acylglucosamine 2-epimerase (GlcNAc 2-epimerase) [Candidatus Kentron sp. FM]
MRKFISRISLLGTVTRLDPEQKSFTVRCRSEDEFTFELARDYGSVQVLGNLDNMSRDTFSEPSSPLPDHAEGKTLKKYLRVGDLLSVEGVTYIHKGDPKRIAQTVSVLQGPNGRFLFEETNWWLSQIRSMGDEWLAGLFGNTQTYTPDKFMANYRTNLNISGGPTDSDLQATATLARYIYGLSSSYLLTGDENFMSAAKAAVEYQMNGFRYPISSDRQQLWIFGRRLSDHGAVAILPSENYDDKGTIALYEQIYALAGLTQYYRITRDPVVLQEIRMTVQAFQDFFYDATENGLPGYGGYFSHVDPATFRPDSERLDSNQLCEQGGKYGKRLRKNWNSIGDHIPAYLVNLIIALEPLDEDAPKELRDFLDVCKGILDETSDLIMDKFPDPNPNVPYVHERFSADWTPETDWGWQKDCAIVGHNLKIAWNLTRIACYYQGKGNTSKAERAVALAEKLGGAMVEHGLDILRGGCYDGVWRKPAEGLSIETVWGTHKDFWQQEQGILAYLILYGYTGKKEYLDLGREMAAFWNLHFLDKDNRGVFFRVHEDGSPIIEGQYANKAGYPIAGYHSFELNYLAHIYTRAYVTGPEDKEGFCLYFKPVKHAAPRSLNVLPDFIKPETIAIDEVTIDGIPMDIDKKSKDAFHVPLEKKHMGKMIVVRYKNLPK